MCPGDLYVVVRLRAAEGEERIVLDEEELLDARWMSAEEVEARCEAAEDEGNFAVVDEPLPLTDVQTVATASQPTARAVVVTGALTGGDVEKPTTFGSYAFTLRLCDAPAETCEPGTLAFSAKLSLATAVADPARLVLVWGSPESDSAFGFGEQYTHLDMKGRRVPVLVSEQGVGRGLQPVTDALGGAGGSW